MCFSATASFGAALILGAVGAVSVHKIKEQSQLPFGVIPILFGLHQAAEGLVWIGMEDHEGRLWVDVSVYVYLIFAQVIWPVWVPFSILAMEKKPSRQKMLRILLVMGALVSTYLLYCLIVYEVGVEIRSGHIEYTLYFPEAGVWPIAIIYFIAIILSPLISDHKRLNFLGLLLLMSFLVSQLFFSVHLISIWCFFAAVLSIMVLWIIMKMNSQNSVRNVHSDA